LLQSGVAIVAFAMAWGLGINPFDRFTWNAPAIALGIGGTLPLLLMFVVTYRYAFGPFRRIKLFLIDGLGPHLAACRWYHLVWVAVLTGFSEELLFRGVIQTWLSPGGTVSSLLVSNLLFGLAHSVTPTYVVLAGVMGLYLGGLYEIGHQNLLPPIVTHALYDLIAFFVVRNSYLSQPPAIEFDE
jgi:membrane protease YdiL (CAAX protease family)